jgi:hypothetical protein
MKIEIRNLGALKQASFELGQMTVFCGCNNTGKTYATYALFGFLSLWRQFFSIRIPDAKIEYLLADGAVVLDLDSYVQQADEIVSAGCRTYTSQLSSVFAAPPERFVDSGFQVVLDPSDIQPLDSFERRMGAAKSELFSIVKSSGSSDLVVSLLVERDKVRIPPEVIQRAIGDAIKDILFGHLFPPPFIASAERTGAAIFRKELNFARNRLLEHVAQSDKDLSPLEWLSKAYQDYALPVKTNVEFTRQIETLVKNKSFVAHKHPDLLTDFADIIGGEYTVTRNDELYYIPKGKRIRLSMDESSSAVRSLLDVGFYLAHVAQPGDLLMVDEPELNLHPENQRKVARLFARLLNIGVKVFITTHSDYIIKELNTLIMLGREKPHLDEIRTREGYRIDEMLCADQLRVYIAEEALVKVDGNSKRSKCMTLVKADIDPELGIEARSFDSTIEEMNRIQEEIVWGHEDE